MIEITNASPEKRCIHNLLAVETRILKEDPGISDKSYIPLLNGFFCRHHCRHHKTEKIDFKQRDFCMFEHQEQTIGISKRCI